MFTVDTPRTLSNSIIGFIMVYRPTNITGGHLLAGVKVWQWNKRDCEKKRPKHMSRGDPGADRGETREFIDFLCWNISWPWDATETLQKLPNAVAV